MKRDRNRRFFSELLEQAASLIAGTVIANNDLVRRTRLGQYTFPLRRQKLSAIVSTHGNRDFHGRILPNPVSNTFRSWTFCLLARLKRGSGVPFPESIWATYSPTAGPCLNPCPDPPPTSQTFSNPGCLSIKKSPLDVFSYWQTRVSVTGASASSGTRWPMYSRTASNPDVVTTRCPLSGSNSGP